MKVSTKIQYGIRLMFQLALRYGQGYAFLHDIARRENMSEKYLSLIVIPLRAQNLVASTRGSHGGYMLAKPPHAVSMLDIIRALEGGFELVSPARPSHDPTPAARCIEREVWQSLQRTISDTLSNITLADLVDAYQRQIASSLTYEI